ncbi:MAG: hypothetical protein HGB12_00295 [Bacteroidetes bacterium]|nr:hypothetical protein [Bacteroidota bacterium]
MKKVLILGSTSHIAKGLIYYFEQDKDIQLSTLSCRDSEWQYYLYKINPNIIINCVGKGTASKISTIDYQDLWDYNYIDNIIIDYLKHKTKPIYINMSSWIVTKDIRYGDRQHHYKINKQYLEMKHRLLPELNIIDLRIPAYFSRWINLDSGFLMSNILKHIKDGDEFNITTRENKKLYYITPRILYDIIRHFLISYEILETQLNTYFDLKNNVGPIKLHHLLDYFGIINKFKDDNVDNAYEMRNIIYEYKEWRKLNGIC